MLLCAVCCVLRAVCVGRSLPMMNEHQRRSIVTAGERARRNEECFAGTAQARRYRELLPRLDGMRDGEASAAASHAHRHWATWWRKACLRLICHIRPPRWRYVMTSEAAGGSKAAHAPVSLVLWTPVSQFLFLDWVPVIDPACCWPACLASVSW